PFALGLGARALVVSIAISGVALFVVGAVLSLFSGRSGMAGGARMMALGAAAGAATWTIGRLLGVGIS
ncbi:MAG: VIT1/CCC1 transporter family protein, partial [Acidobacteria bacterium]|nr:VIT1/CCC1 transporter family protein [Acidobacteriota bacterium]